MNIHQTLQQAVHTRLKQWKDSCENNADAQKFLPLLTKILNVRVIDEFKSRIACCPSEKILTEIAQQCCKQTLATLDQLCPAPDAEHTQFEHALSLVQRLRNLTRSNTQLGDSFAIVPSNLAQLHNG